jgi:membrane fusion protein, macrolide-specific efflux system
VGVRHSERKRRWTVRGSIAAAAVVALGAAGWAVFLRPSNAASSAASYRAVPVTTGTIRQAVAATGTIDPADTEDLNFSAAGKVTAVYVTEGQSVAKGQKLAAIDSASLSSAVAAAQASLATAQARLVSDEDASASSEQLASDQANITLAQTQLAQAQSALSGATLTSPIAGTVSAVDVTVGQQVAGGSSGAGGGAGSGNGNGSGNASTPSASGASSSNSSSSASSSGGSSSSAQIEVVSTGSYVVNASVDASEIGLIRKNDQVVIRPSTTATTAFGLVASIGVVATSTSGVASFPVTVAVTGRPSGLYPGATADLQIVYRQLTDVLVVPTLAISRSGGTATVLVESGGERTTRQITTGPSSGGMTQVVSGLREGEQVLVPVAQNTNRGTGTGGRNGTGTGGRNGTGGGTGGGFGGGFGGGGFPKGGIGGADGGAPAGGKPMVTGGAQP